MVVAVFSVARPYKSLYEGGFYQCVSIHQSGWYECGYGSYLFNIATDRYLDTLRFLGASPYMFGLVIVFFGEGGEPSIQYLLLILLSMPYVFIPLTCFGLRKYYFCFAQGKSRSLSTR